MLPSAARRTLALLGLLPLVGPGALAGQSDAVPAVSGVRLEVRERFYDLEESSLSGVISTLNSMRLEGPQGPRSQGLTQYRVVPAWRPAAGGGNCRVTGLALNVSVTITLPRWEGARWASGPDRDDWERILGAIREHEYRHRDLVVEAANTLHGTLSGMERRGCGPLRRSFEGAVAIANARLTRAHQDFDAAEPSRLIRGGGGLP